MRGSLSVALIVPRARMAAVRTCWLFSTVARCRDVLVPDLAGWRHSRMPKLPETAWFEVPPDWICEILSLSMARVDRAERLPAYARHGAVHAWLVDPDQRTLEVFVNRDGK